MSDGRSSDARRALVATRWVHVFGDDVEAGAVFRDETGDVPLSRRPKEYLQFDDDGTVRRLATGADDRAHEVDRATWRDDGDAIAFTFATPDAQGATEYRIVERSADRLVIRRR